MQTLLEVNSTDFNSLKNVKVVLKKSVHSLLEVAQLGHLIFVLPHMNVHNVF